MPQFSQKSAEPKDFLFDTEELHALAESSLIRKALRHTHDNRVTRVTFADGELLANVEDEDSEEQLDVFLYYDADGNLWSTCDCDGTGGICVHALAALLAFGTADEEDAQLSGAWETAIEERVKRGRAEVRVEPLSGEPWFGTWRARSIAAAGSHFQSSYQVQIRSLTRRANHCTCPDFATNQLGTCKHIEAVLHRVGKRKDFAQIKHQPPSMPYVYLDWESDDAPRIRLHRGTEIAVHLGSLLSESFDAGGAFSGRLPEDFLRFAELADGDENLLIGDDALGFARRLADDAARELRAREIGERIRSSGGRLPDIRARLYPYQVEGVAFLAGRGRALLADDMGLGKTLQAIAAADLAAPTRGVRDASWWSAPPPSSISGRGRSSASPATRPRSSRDRRRRARSSTARCDGFVVINYELVLRDLSRDQRDPAPGSADPGRGPAHQELAHQDRLRHQAASRPATPSCSPARRWRTGSRTCTA